MEVHGVIALKQLPRVMPLLKHYFNMAETTVSDRLISGSGMLRLPPGEEAVRYYSLLIDVIRLPSRTDRSLRYDPYRQRFATAVFLRDGYVIDEQAIDYTRRRFDYPVNEPGQVLIALKCSHMQVMNRFSALGASGTSSIEEFANLKMLWDEVHFVCYLDTAIQVRLLQDLYDECGDDYREKSPPDPPAPLPPVATGTPIGDISEPYPDDTVTDPYAGDGFPDPDPGEFPAGDTGVGYHVDVNYTFAAGVPRDIHIDVFGKVEFIGVNPDDPNMTIVLHHGVYPGVYSGTNVQSDGGHHSAAVNPDSITYSITPL